MATSSVMQGADFSVRVTFADFEGTAIDLTDGECRYEIKPKVDDPDSRLIASDNSTTSPSNFDLTDAEDGIVIVTVLGSKTSTSTVIKGNFTVFFQLEVELDGHWYRSSNLELIIKESVIKE